MGDLTRVFEKQTPVCVECLVGKQNEPTLFKVTEPSSVPYRTPLACAKRATYGPCDRFFTREIPAVCVEFLFCKVTEPSPLQNCRSAGTVTVRRGRDDSEI
jgi:hypothetical protein